METVGQQPGIPRGAPRFWGIRMFLLCMIFFLCGSTLGSSLIAQSHLFTFPPEQVGTWSYPRPAGDVNGDGMDDILIGASWGLPPNTNANVLQVHSGRDGRLLWAVKTRDGFLHDQVGTGDLDRDGHADIAMIVTNLVANKKQLWYVSGKTGKKFRTVNLNGFSVHLLVARAGDVNADGYQDLVIGDPTWGLFQSGRVVVVSGKDGSFIRILNNPVYGLKYFGSQMAAAGDTNEDGYADLLVADDVGPTAWLFSGKTGQIMKTFGWNSLRVSARFVHTLGDINKDGRRDYALTGVELNPTRVYLEIRSGAKKDKHKVLLTIKEPYPSRTGLGLTVVMVGDIDKDGLPDLALGAPFYKVNGKQVGAIEYRSSKDGRLLSRVIGAGNLTFGYKIYGLGDVNGDGNPDVVVQTEVASLSQKPAPRIKVFVYSGAPMDLWSDTHRVSLAKRGKQVLQLDAGPKHAGSSYFVLGSLGGIKPGLKLGGLTLPLQPDLYFWLTASSPNSAMFQGSLGVLDNHGQATCTITAIPALPTAMIGTRADHAYLLFKNGRFTKTSRWAPLLFEK